MLGLNRNKVACGSLLLAGTLLISQAHMAEANDNSRRAMFHQFAAGHSDLSNRELHRSFRQEFRAQRLEPTQGAIDTAVQIQSNISFATSAPPIQVNEVPTAPAHSLTQLDTGKVVKLESGVSLDLGSSEKNITLGSRLFGEASSVTIQVGGETKTVAAGSTVTASEYVAVKQALSGSGQTLSVDAQGRAAGGTVDFSAITGDGDPLRASNLVNPDGVTIAGDFGKHSDFRLLGDLENHGNVVAFSSSNSVRGGSIRADDITNYDGAVISTANAGGVDLALHARGDFTNYGTVESSGDLTITAGGKLSNTTSGANNRATISAARNIYLNAPEISNNGVIRSEGTITVDAPGTLNFDNNFGSVQAASIVLRDPGFSGAYDTNVYGGDFLSHEIQLNSGEGLLTLNANNISGSVLATGLATHVSATGETLNLGEICLTGDPTFYNTGNISINGNIAVTETLTIVAEGNITFIGGADITAASNTQGFPITLIAGADIIATAGGANQATLGPIPPPNPNNGGVTLSGLGTPGGGFINIGAGSVITTKPLNVNGNKNGGDVLLVALSGTNANSGQITMNSTAQIFTDGSGLGDNGNVTILGDGDMLIQNVETGGASGFGGNVLINNARPQSSSGGNIVYLADGSLGANSNTWVPGTPSVSNSISVSGLFALGQAQLTLVSGSSIANNADVFARNVSLTAVGLCGFSSSCDITASGVLSINAGLVKNTSSIAPGTLSGAFVSITSTGDIGDPIGVNNGSINVINNSGLVFSTGGSASFFLPAISVINPNGESSSAQDNVNLVGNGGTFISGNVDSINGAVLINFSDGVSVESNAVIFAGNGNTDLTSSFGDVNIRDGVSIGSGTGTVSVNCDSGGNIIIGDSVSIGGQTGTTISNSAGAITMGASQISSTTGNTVVQATGGAITIGSGATVQTLDGDLSIINGLDKKLDKIFLQNGSTISALGGAGFGNVLISIGAPDVDIPGKAPKKNLVQNTSAGGQIFFGKKSITANAPDNTLTAKGANLKFNNPISKKNIVLDGAVTIIADPPSIDATTLVVSGEEHKSVRAETIGSAFGANLTPTAAILHTPQTTAPIPTNAIAWSSDKSNLVTVNQLRSEMSTTVTGGRHLLNRKKSAN